MDRWMKNYYRWTLVVDTKMRAMDRIKFTTKLSYLLVGQFPNRFHYLGLGGGRGAGDHVVIQRDERWTQTADRWSIFMGPPAVKC